MSGKTSNILVVISIVLAVPGFIIAAGIPPYNVIGFLCIIIAILLMGFWTVLNLPAWTILRMEKTIKIKYSGQSQTTQKVQIIKKTKMRANHKGLSEFNHRNIRADGNIKGFKLGNKNVPQKNIGHRVGEYIICERFPPMGIWQKRQSELIIEVDNCYPDSTEFSSYQPDFKTKKAKIDINFPVQKPARGVRAYCCIGAETMELPTPTLSTNGLQCTWEGTDLLPGRDYYIEWYW